MEHILRKVLLDMQVSAFSGHQRLLSNLEDKGRSYVLFPTWRVRNREFIHLSTLLVNTILTVRDEIWFKEASAKNWKLLFHVMKDQE